ncbi:hypothetical protein PG994_005794 [Apiospora phragmitis]|uniref:Uncharacterized protein n=1 Tax=Apiospora phragmitis TaxID=2905665 RepID=A0ABR1VD79_9PEZI
MQFTTSLIPLLAAAASSVMAAPAEAGLAARQETPRIYAKFYSGNGCDGTWVEDTVWLQGAGGQCIVNNIPFEYASTLVQQNYATRTLRAYASPNCNETGNHFDVPAGVTDCWYGQVGSVKFL